MQGFVTGAILLASVCSVIAVNPISRYGKCKNYKPINNLDLNKNKGTWYLQGKPVNEDNYVHTCQAVYEKDVKYYTSFLYYYNKGQPVNRPIQSEYAVVSPGILRGAITVDGEAVNIYVYYLYVNKDYTVRVQYMCTDHPKANPDLDAILVYTREEVPYKSDKGKPILELGFTAAKDAYRSVNGKELKLEQVTQDLGPCDPLEIYDNVENPLKG